MRRPIVSAMSGISMAVLGLSVHASHRTTPSPLTGAATGLVLTPSNPRATATSAPSTGAIRTAKPSTTRSHAATTQPSASKRPGAKRTSSTVTINGSPVDTRYGPVQVQITLRSGNIIRAQAIDYPQGGGRDQEINSQAVPQLDDETIRYRQSLQSALDAAHQASAR